MSLTTEQRIDQLGVVLVDILSELRWIHVAMGASGSISSVEVKTSTRGNDVVVKSYAGSDVQAAGEAAVDEYVRVVADLNNKLAGALNGGGKT